MLGCYTLRQTPVFILITGILCILSLLSSIVGTILLGCVLFIKQVIKKKVLSTTSQVLFLIALFALLIALLLFPVKFWMELALWKRNNWRFGWAFGVAWGAVLFLTAAILFTLCERRSESAQSATDSREGLYADSPKQRM